MSERMDFGKIVWDTSAIIDCLEDPEASAILFQAVFDGKIQITAPTILELASYATPGPGMEARSRFLDGFSHYTNVILPDFDDYFAAGMWLRGLKARRKTEKEDWKMDAIIAATAWMEDFALVGKDKDFKAIRENGAEYLELDPDELEIHPPQAALEELM